MIKKVEHFSHITDADIIIYKDAWLTPGKLFVFFFPKDFRTLLTL
jgi:hypothetical protein